MAPDARSITARLHQVLRHVSGVAAALFSERSFQGEMCFGGDPNVAPM